MEFLKYFSYEKFSKYVLDEIKEITKEADDINIKINREKLDKLINVLEKKVKQIETKYKIKDRIVPSSGDEALVMQFRDLFNLYAQRLKQLKEVTDRPYDKYEVVAILNRLEEDIEETIEITKEKKLSLIGIGSFIFIILTGIITAIIIPTIKHKKKKKNKI